MVSQSHLSAIIRQRGQLTLPDVLRKRFSWLAEGNTVHIVVGEDGSIIVQPYGVKQNNFTTLKRDLERLRKLKGARGNLSQSVISDRYAHE